MASIKYLIQSKSSSAPIYARLSLGRNQVYKRKTGFFIDAKQWSKTTGYPKNKSDEGRDLKKILKKLELAILEKLNRDNTEGEEITGDWLLNTIDLHFKRISTSEFDSEYLMDAIQEYLNGAEFRDNSKGGKGLSKSRILGIKRLQSLIKEFAGKKKYKVRDVDLSFGNKFQSWMFTEQNYSKSYTLKMIDNLKTVCYNAELNGVKTNPQLKKVKGGKLKNENIIFLSHEELERIEALELHSEAYINARKWLILGCHIGQRGGDLLNLTEKNLSSRSSSSVLELTQQKTGKLVTIPLSYEARDNIKSGFPRKISIQKFNEHIKKICKKAEINELIHTGKICMVPKTENSKEIVKRKVFNDYEKWELVTSHICRRSFATNLHDKLPLPYIMSITGHTSEKSYLNYIGKSSGDYVAPIADFFEKQRVEKQKQRSKLTVIQDKAINH